MKRIFRLGRLLFQVSLATTPGERHWWQTDGDGNRRDYLLSVNTVTKEDGARLWQLTLGPLDVLVADTRQLTGDRN